MTIKHVAIFGAALALLGGCASAPEQKPVEPTPAPAPAPVAPTPRAVEAPKPAPAPAPAPAPVAPKITTLKGVGLFDFDKSVLRPDAKTALDSAIVAKK